MSSLSKPLLSLSASGTVAGTVSYSESKRRHTARKTPSLPYQNTLLQQYQRWDYKDAAYFWSLLSASEKAYYASEASRYHLTHFGAYARYFLRNLPHLAARWHLDYSQSVLRPDSSKNSNTGSVIGASLAQGRIDGALLFDGVDDRIEVADSPSLNITSALTLSAFIYWYSKPTWNIIVEKGTGTLYTLYANSTFNRLSLLVKTTAGVVEASTPNGSLSFEAWHHVAGTYDGANLRVYIDGALLQTLPQTGSILTSAAPLRIGHRQGQPAGLGFNGIIDEVLVGNQALETELILSHSGRGYSP